MVECTFVIVRNKWRVFHCAIDICPDFYNVIVKTCCILHNLVCQRDGFQFRILYTNVPSTVLWLLSVEVRLQERIWGGGLLGRECLSIGELAGG